MALHTTPEFGTELYRVDPLVGVTDQVVVDINPGPADSNPSRVRMLGNAYLAFYATPCDGCDRSIMLFDGKDIVVRNLFAKSRSPTDLYMPNDDDSNTVYAKSSSSVEAYFIPNATTKTIADPRRDFCIVGTGLLQTHRACC